MALIEKGQGSSNGNSAQEPSVDHKTTMRNLAQIREATKLLIEMIKQADQDVQQRDKIIYSNSPPGDTLTDEERKRYEPAWKEDEVLLERTVELQEDVNAFLEAVKDFHESRDWLYCYERKDERRC